ncbi:hypothetical protein AN639_03730 [Candidatus Epulonipiscium fishelsonii]|uniref:Uncharacterized protein n=1 Tax=Candidatus Epulonipiscium fishelsonii TaxID=77094 RepID=A0ACC8X6F4_9FIRM|nr:hypothetical protein AN396_12795 [Epulopiscium sp. SCG-B11WGA-EpuloA1]ONI41472.1 hypothetical protein AN639_03730 [Epulopiscium sp. SCG-B05WGA-EpuloA1]
MKKYIGVEISKQGAKIVVASKSGKIIKFIATYQVNYDTLEEGCFFLENMLVQLIDQYKIKRYGIKVALVGDLVIHRMIEVQAIDHKHVKNILECRINEYIPIGNHYTDFKIVAHNKKTNSFKVLLVVVSKVVIDNLTTLGRDLNLKLDIITSVGVVLSSYQKSLGKLDIIIDLGYYSTKLISYRSNNVIWSKELDIGMNLIDNSIRKEFKEEDSAAIEEFKIRYANFKPDKDNLYENIIYEIANDEIKKYLIQDILKFIQGVEEHVEDKVNKIYLIGGGAKLRNIEEYLEQQLKFTVEKFKLDEIDSVLENDPVWISLTALLNMHD